jgi:beta-mannosidase
MLVSLTAGESHTFLVRTSATLPEPSDLARPEVLCCANTLARGQR